MSRKNADFGYVHGYSVRESRRLSEQSEILRDLLHDKSFYEQGRLVLEAGCGVGAQTVILAENSPAARFVSIDISEDSLSQAREAVKQRGFGHVTFRQADIVSLPFRDEEFDAVFVCFVLEHLSDPAAALAELKRVLRPGGEITVIEGDHGSCFWNPETDASKKVWECLIRAQARFGHDANIGRRIAPLLSEAGFTLTESEPRWVYGDLIHPGLLDGMVNQIIVPMVQTARSHALEAGWADETTWEAGIRDLEASGHLPGGTFFYTWFRARAKRPGV